jgi:hypothetical protein
MLATPCPPVSGHSRRISSESLSQTETRVPAGSEPELKWYNSWIQSQIRELPHALKQLRVGGGSLLEEGPLQQVFRAIAEYVHDKDGVSIDEIIQNLQELKILEENEELQGAHRLLVFTILGWQSMLYKAAFDICSPEELAIHEEENQPNSGLVYDNTKVPASLCDRPLFVLLKAFGNLLPSPPLTIGQTARESGNGASTWMPLYPLETNAYFLISILRVKVRWVDSLSMHLDYDKSTRTISLFSRPSFCLLMLESRGPIFAFASTELAAVDPRANEDDIRHLLGEVLLSFRLLFGQCPKSRKLFPQVFQPHASVGDQVDSLLPLICMTKSFRHKPAHFPQDQPVYFANQHFPVLFEKIELIAKELNSAKPSGMRDILKDNRDKYQWWTFWLVAWIGGFGLILSLIQVVLQALQLAQV